MDWQTKDYLDERLDALEDKLDTIMEHFKIDQDTEEPEEDNETEENSELEI